MITPIGICFLGEKIRKEKEFLWTVSKNNVSISRCFLEVDDPFGFLGHVVAGRNDVRWLALRDKLLSNAGLSSSLPVTCAQLGPPLLSVSLSP